MFTVYSNIRLFLIITSKITKIKIGNILESSEIASLCTKLKQTEDLKPTLSVKWDNPQSVPDGWCSIVVS